MKIAKSTAPNRKTADSSFARVWAQEGRSATWTTIADVFLKILGGELIILA
jgi:hypothetical protein